VSGAVVVGWLVVGAAVTKGRLVVDGPAALVVGVRTAVVVVVEVEVVVEDVVVVDDVLVDEVDVGATTRSGSSRARLGTPATATPRPAPTTSKRARAHPCLRTSEA
jgi:hypothetical protein